MEKNVTDNALVHLTFLSTTDEHGHLLPQQGVFLNRQSKKVGGFAYLAGAVDEIRKENPNTILTSSGDFFQESPISELFNGSPMIETMNEIKYDAMELGNHDFDFGTTQLLNLLGMAHFPILGANISKRKNRSTNSSKITDIVKPYIIKNIGGIKVGIVGVDTPDVPELIPSRKYVADYNFLSPKETLQNVIPEIKEKGADIVMLLSHQGVKENLKSIKGIEGIDLIWSGHSHEFLEKPIKTGDTIIGQAGCYGQALARIDLYYDKDQKKIVQSEYKLIPIDVKRIKANQKITELIEVYNAQTKKILSQILGFADIDLKHSTVKAGNLDNYIIDHLKTAVNADLALMNAKAVRQSLLSGNITVGDLYQIFPFHTNVISMDLTGAQIKKLLEHSAEMNDDRSLYVSSGMKVIYDTRKPTDSRVVSITLNGKPLDYNKTYHIACDAYLSGGGLGYNEFLNGKNVKEGMKVRDMLSEAIKIEKHINPKEETRIEDIAPKALAAPIQNNLFKLNPGRHFLSLPNRIPLPAQL